MAEVRDHRRGECIWGCAAAIRRFLHLLVLYQKVHPSTTEKTDIHFSECPKELPQAQGLWDASLAGDYDAYQTYHDLQCISPPFAKVCCFFYLTS